MSRPVGTISRPIMGLPRALVRCNAMLAEKAIAEDARSYVMPRLMRGDRIATVATDLSVLVGERITQWQLYEWVRRWKADPE